MFRLEFTLFYGSLDDRALVSPMRFKMQGIFHYIKISCYQLGKKKKIQAFIYANSKPIWKLFESSFLTQNENEQACQTTMLWFVNFNF